MASKDYYTLLGVSRTASEKEVRTAYRKLARQYHPDVNLGDISSEARFKEINEAYEVLSDGDKRKKYDQYGENWQYADQFTRTGAGVGGFGPAGTGSGRTKPRRGSGPQPGQTGEGFGFENLGGIGDIFDLFGRNSGRSRPRAQRGDDVEHPVEITLEEAYNGAVRTVQMETEEVCSICNGTGLVSKAVCSACGGAGVVPKIKRLEVKIPAGVKDGERVRIAGQGGAGTGGSPRGDLFLQVTVRPHDRFERKGDDLYEDVAVPLATAVLGGEVEVPTIRGTKVMLKIPGETQNGGTIRLAGLGMPRVGNAARGDLFARVKVALPSRLTPKQRELFEQLRDDLAPQATAADS